MAVGTVSGIEPDDNWQLIATNTPSAAASSIFSSVSGYKKLMLVYKNYTTSASGPARLSFNSDTTAGNYVSNADWGTYGVSAENVHIGLGSYAYTSQIRSGYVIINNVDKSLPHTVDGAAFDATIISGIYVIANPITSLTITGPGGTITGTFYLYGIAA